MPFRILRRSIWLLLLLLQLFLLLCVCLTVRLSFANSVKSQVSEEATTSALEQPLKTNSLQDKRPERGLAEPNIPIQKAKVSSANNKFDYSSNFIIENPLPEEPTERAPATSRPPSKATLTLKVQTTTSTPKTLRQRIEEASDASLHSQMLAKLSSLGSSVTEAQVLNAASKCGGKKPAVRYVLNYEFVRAAEHLCTGELLALIAVHSNAKNIDRRATIRRTWGSLRYIGRFRIEVAFFLGRPASGDSDVESGAKGAQLDALIEAESRRFGDIVQLNFTENYRNLTIKHLGVYEWLLRHCKSAQHLVKVDDDTFTDVAHLATFLSRGAPSGFYCSATRGAKPQRVRRGVNWKWTVSIAEFDGKFYPTYCEGYGDVIHTRHIADIYLCSLFKQFFWIDDVHVTGILASLMDTPVNRFWRGHGYSVLVPSLASELIMDYIFLTAYNSEFFPGLWGKLWHAALRHSLDVAL